MSKNVCRSSKQDEGYAWVILFAAFVLKAVEDGIQQSSGLFFVEYLEQFGETRAATAWVGSITIGVLNLSGPIAALVVNKCGYRVCMILGSVIMSSSFILSYFAPNLYYLYTTAGAMQGFGLGLMQLGGTVCTSKYFKKKRALAVGISYCGGGIGLFAIAPLIRYLIDVYTWRGAMLILSGISLNGCVFSSLLRPFVEEEEEKETDKGMDLESNEALLRDKRDKDSVSPMGEIDAIEHKLKLENNDILNKSETITRNDGQNIPLLVIKDCDENVLRQNEETSSNCEQFRYSSNNPAEISHNSNANELELSTQNTDSNTNNENVKFDNSFIEGIFPKAMLININFIILMCATVFISLPELVPFTMLPDFALIVNCTPSQSAWIVSAIGIGATVSYVFGGWLSDLKCVNSVLLLAICTLGVGITTMIAAVIPMLETLMAYGVLFGGFSGSMYLLQPIVLFEYIGEEYMAATMGVLMGVYGVFDLVGAPLAGLIFDQTGSYTISFLVAGASFALSSAITCLVFCTKTGRK